MLDLPTIKRKPEAELNLDFTKSKDFRIVNLKALQRKKQWNKIIRSKKRAINFRKRNIELA